MCYVAQQQRIVKIILRLVHSSESFEWLLIDFPSFVPDVTHAHAPSCRLMMHDSPIRARSLTAHQPEHKSQHPQHQHYHLGFASEHTDYFLLATMKVLSIVMMMLASASAFSPVKKAGSASPYSTIRSTALNAESSSRREVFSTLLLGLTLATTATVTASPADATTLDFSLPSSYDTKMGASKGNAMRIDPGANEKEKQLESMQKAEESRKAALDKKKAEQKARQDEDKRRAIEKKKRDAERVKNIWN
jgi:hypothetical protein